VTIDGNFVKLQIWDTAGQERFKGITKSYYNKADAVIIVYDIDDHKTFADIKSTWLKEVKMYCQPESKIFVFANKCDGPRSTIKDTERKYFYKEDIPYYTTSARSGYFVNDSFCDIARRLMFTLPKNSEKPMVLGLGENHPQRHP
jgi:small GTP-binding protein